MTSTTTSAAPAPRRLPVWQTVRTCYAAVACDLGQLMQISWLWLLIMLPVYAMQHWLDRAGSDGDGVAGLLAKPATSAAMLATVMLELLFLASIAVAWHRLILRRERITAPAYLRLDRTVRVYLFYSLLLTLLALVPVAVFLALIGLSEVAASLVGEEPVSLALSLTGATFALVGIVVLMLIVVPRLSAVLPAVALGRQLSLREAWRASRANTMRLALATVICLLPSLFVLLLPELVGFLLRLPWWLGFSWPRIVDFISATSPVRYFLQGVLSSLGYAVFSSLAHAVLTIFAVTLLSLTYRFFLEPGDGSASPAP